MIAAGRSGRHLNRPLGLGGQSRATCRLWEEKATMGMAAWPSSRHSCCPVSTEETSQVWVVTPPVWIVNLDSRMRTCSWLCCTVHSKDPTGKAKSTTSFLCWLHFHTAFLCRVKLESARFSKEKGSRNARRAASITFPDVTFPVGH